MLLNCGSGEDSSESLGQQEDQTSRRSMQDQRKIRKRYPGLGRSPGGEHGSPLQYCCLENPMDGGDWRTIVHGVAELDTIEAT